MPELSRVFVIVLKRKQRLIDNRRDVNIKINQSITFDGSDAMRVIRYLKTTEIEKLLIRRVLRYNNRETN